MRLRKNFTVVKNLLNTCFKQWKYYCDSSNSNRNGYREAHIILVYSHIIEKGLSHKNPKPLFGLKRVKAISESLYQYIDKGGCDSYIIDTGVAAIKKYNTYNANLGVSEMIPIPETAESRVINQIQIGTYETTKESLFKNADQTFTQLCNTRHSIRLYDTKSQPIDKLRLIKCIKLAQRCPNACNRQSVRVKVLLDNEKIEKLESIQGGCTGFGKNSGAILIVTVDLGYYASSENGLPMLDAGIFSMNLAYALFEDHLGSCILNCAFTTKQEKQMRELCPISNSEIYAAIVAVSDIPDNEAVRIPLSDKRPDIISII